MAGHVEVLRIVSWNISCDNEAIDHALDSLTGNLAHPSDIICLQEVSWHIVERLRTLDHYTVSLAEDFHEKKPRCDERTLYLVILSRHKHKVKRVKKHYYKGKIRHTWARMRDIEEGKEFVYVDVVLENGTMLRVFNVHLDAFVGSRRRLQQFRAICRHLSLKHDNIICGDFNMADRFYVSFIHFVLVWCALIRFGGMRYFLHPPWRDLLIREKKTFEKKCELVGMKGVFKDHVTYVSWYGSLSYDDMLVPASARVVQKEVSKELHGSDHYPILSVIDLGMHSHGQGDI